MDVASLCPLPVGVVYWSAPSRSLTVIAKATFSLQADGVAELAGQQLPLTPAGSAQVGDFAPKKAAADVLVVGHAWAPSPTPIIPIGLQVDGLERRVYAVSQGPEPSLPLSRSHLRTAASHSAGQADLGPISTGLVAGWEHHSLTADTDYSGFNVAPPEQRLRRLRSSSKLVLEGLLAGAPRREVRLPGLRPRIFYLPSRSAEAAAQEMALSCDTLLIDTDRALCALTWRGVRIMPPHTPATACLVVALASPAQAQSWQQVAGQLGRVSWVRAAEAHPAAPAAETAHDRGRIDQTEVVSATDLLKLAAADGTGEVPAAGVTEQAPPANVTRAMTAADMMLALAEEQTGSGPAPATRPVGSRTAEISGENILRAAELPFLPTAGDGGGVPPRVTDDEKLTFEELASGTIPASGRAGAGPWMPFMQAAEAARAVSSQAGRQTLVLEEDGEPPPPTPLTAGARDPQSGVDPGRAAPAKRNVTLEVDEPATVLPLAQRPGTADPAGSRELPFRPPTPADQAPPPLAPQHIDRHQGEESTGVIQVDKIRRPSLPFQHPGSSDDAAAAPSRPAIPPPAAPAPVPPAAVPPAAVPPAAVPPAAAIPAPSPRPPAPVAAPPAPVLAPPAAVPPAAAIPAPAPRPPAPVAAPPAPVPAPPAAYAAAALAAPPAILAAPPAAAPPAVASPPPAGGPSSDSLTLREYARIKARVDEADDPSVVLSNVGLSRARWAQLRREWSKRCLNDRTLAGELRKELAKARKAARGPG